MTAPDDSNTTLRDLIRQATAFRDARDWKQFHTPKELAINLVVESGELLQLMQWHAGPALDDHLSRRREDVEDELSDVLHSVLLIADEMGIDLATAFASKMAKNERKYPVEKARGSAKKYDEL